MLRTVPSRSKRYKEPKWRSSVYVVGSDKQLGVATLEHEPEDSDDEGDGPPKDLESASGAGGTLVPAAPPLDGGRGARLGSSGGGGSMLPTPVALPSPPLRVLIRDAQNAGDDGQPLILGEASVDVKALGVSAVMGAVGNAVDAVVDIDPPADWPLDVDYDGRADFTTGRLHLSLVWSAPGPPPPHVPLWRRLRRRLRPYYVRIAAVVLPITLYTSYLAFFTPDYHTGHAWDTFPPAPPLPPFPPPSPPPPLAPPPAPPPPGPNYVLIFLEEMASLALLIGLLCGAAIYPASHVFRMLHEQYEAQRALLSERLRREKALEAERRAAEEARLAAEAAAREAARLAAEEEARRRAQMSDAERRMLEAEEYVRRTTWQNVKLSEDERADVFARLTSPYVPVTSPRQWPPEGAHPITNPLAVPSSSSPGRSAAPGHSPQGGRPSGVALSVVEQARAAKVAHEARAAKAAASTGASPPHTVAPPTPTMPMLAIPGWSSAESPGVDRRPYSPGPKASHRKDGPERATRGRAPTRHASRPREEPLPAASRASAELRDLKKDEREGHDRPWRVNMSPRVAGLIGVPEPDLRQQALAHASATTTKHNSEPRSSRRQGGGTGLLGMLFGGGARTSDAPPSESDFGSLHDHDDALRAPGPRAEPTLWSFSSALGFQKKVEVLRDATQGAEVVHSARGAGGVAAGGIGVSGFSGGAIGIWGAGRDGAGAGCAGSASARLRAFERARLRLADRRIGEGDGSRGARGSSAEAARPESNRLARLSALPGDLLGWKPKYGSHIDDEKLEGLLAASLPISQSQRRERRSPSPTHSLAEVSGYYRTRGQRSDGDDRRLEAMQREREARERRVAAARLLASSPVRSMEVRGGGGDDEWLRGLARSSPKLLADGSGADGRPLDIRQNFESIRQDAARRWAERQAALNGEAGGVEGDADGTTSADGGLGGGAAFPVDNAAAVRRGGSPPGLAAPSLDNDHWTNLEGLLRNDGLKLRVIDIFRFLDKDGDGTVTKDEFCKRLIQLGAPYTLSSQIANLFEEIDADGKPEAPNRIALARTDPRHAPDTVTDDDQPNFA